MTSFLQRPPDPTYRTVLVPLDGSAFASGALPTANALAQKFGATVQTVTVAGSDDEAQHARSTAAGALGTEPDDPRVHLEFDPDVAGAVQRCASQLESCLVCLTTRGRGRVAGAVLGSTARDIVARIAAPVVVAGPEVVFLDPADPEDPRPLGTDHLVACVDGTPSSEQGLPMARAWARALGMRLTIVTVAEPCPPPMRIGDPWRRHHGPNEDADLYMDRLRERWAPEIPDVQTAVVYDPISPGDGMKEYLGSHPTGLVAVTSHVREPLARLMHGSGAAGIVQTSTAPVLVVPAHAVEG
jgi:nucleotide-binding universal stress UspA family protein